MDQNAEPTVAVAAAAPITTALVPTTADLAKQVVDELFSLELEQSLAQLEVITTQAFPQLPAPQQAELEPLMQGLWHFFRGTALVREGDFSETAEHFENSAKIFSQFGFPELRDLSVGMGAYSMAVLMLRQMNVGQALEYFKKVKSYLTNAGKFSTRFQSMIDHMEPEALVTAGVQQLTALDFANAKVLLDKAALMSEKVASKYYAEDKKMANTFNGLAQFYRSFYLMISALTNLNQFSFDKIQEKPNLAGVAKSAQDLLSQGDLENQNVANTVKVAGGIAASLESIQELAALMEKVFASTFTADLHAIRHIRLNFEKAKDDFSQAGLQALTLVRYCDMLLTQVDNLERLARPNKKDFGIFSGMISCGLFVPLFFLVFWANRHFGGDTGGGTLLWASLGLALIGGFGFGALKFKSFFSFAFGQKEEKASDPADK